MAKYLKYPLDLGSNSTEYKHYIQFTTLAERITSSTPAIDKVCMLYLPPDAVKTSYAQSYADADLGQAGGAIRRAQNIEKLAMATQGGNTESILSAVGEVGGKNLSSLIKAAVGGAVREAAGTVNPGATAAITNRIGAVINNHKALIYQGPGGFRTFTYNFTMIPESQDEADEIQDIVEFFKISMHPDTGSFGYTGDGPDEEFGFQGNQGINSSMLFSYPDEFKISMHSNGTENVKLFKIDKCFLESFSVDHSTQGAAAFFDSGDPVTTTISMQFKETAIMTRRKIREGY